MKDQVCDVIDLSYTLGNLHPKLGIQEMGNRATLLARMDYFQTLLDQALINYAAYLIFTEETQQGVEAAFEQFKDKYLKAQARMSQYAQRVEFGQEGKQNANKAVGQIIMSMAGKPDSKENYEMLQRQITQYLNDVHSEREWFVIAGFVSV